MFLLLLLILFRGVRFRCIKSAWYGLSVADEEVEVCTIDNETSSSREKPQQWGGSRLFNSHLERKLMQVRRQ